MLPGIYIYISKEDRGFKAVCLHGNMYADIYVIRIDVYINIDDLTLGCIYTY